MQSVLVEGGFCKMSKQAFMIDISLLTLYRFH